MISDIDIKNHSNISNIKVRNDKVIYESNVGIITIPSKQFPLENKRSIRIFSMLNTEPVDILDINIATKLINTFNAHDVKIGQCYINSERLMKMFDDDIRPKLKSYVGWLLLKDRPPIHHCWLVYDNRVILDGTENYSTDFVMETMKGSKNLEEQRKILLDITLEREKLLNSKRFTFGKCSDLYIYIGTECSPMEGKEIYKRLTSKYPNHISYRRSMNSKGMSKFQQMYYETKSK
ncbi:hypothetical protein [uncultured Clostridium sp.]|uniref:hypothetical protein n=1 Tax=uncultured Clostridium sp. TaxID=59620 RepID=UPI003216E324